MKTTSRLLTVAIICLTMAVFGASAQGRGGQRPTQTRQSGQVSAPRNNSNMGSRGQATSPSFNRGSQGQSHTISNSRPSTPASTPSRPSNSNGSSVTPSRPSFTTPSSGSYSRPEGNNHPGRQPGNVTPGGSSVTPSRPSGNTPGNGNYTRPEGNNRPGQQPGNVTPGNNNRPGNNNGPGNNRPDNNRPDNNGGAFHRPDYGHQPSHQPGNQPVPGPEANRPGGPRPGVPAPGVRPAPNTRPPVWVPRPRPWVAPRPPMHWRPAGVFPSFSTILGVTLGTAINITLDHLLTQGYTVHSYGNDVVYLNNVNQLNMLWPDASLYYTSRGLERGDFIYSTPYYDTARYNLAYSRLVAAYGNPVATTYPTDGFQTQWFGTDGRFVTLTYQPLYGNDGVLRYYTTLSFGW